jgi:hypothetical protein
MQLSSSDESKISWYDWRLIFMAFVGEAMEDMLVQKAYGNLKKRGYSYPLSSCYYVLLGILDREGEEALNEYVRTVEIR